MAPRQLFPGRPPAPDPVQSGGLLSGFVNPFADMDAATQGGLLALAGNLMSARDRGMSFGGALGMGLTDFAQTKAALAGQEDQRKLRGLQTKAAERDLAAGEKQAKARETALGSLSPEDRTRAEAMGDSYWTQEAKPTWRMASPEERQLGIAAIETTTGKPMMLPGEYNTSNVEQQKMMLEQLRFQAQQGNQAAQLALQQAQLAIAQQNANKPQIVQGPNGEITSVPVNGGEMTQLRAPNPRELSTEEIKQKSETGDAIAQTQLAQSKLQELQALNPDVPGGPTATLQKWWSWATDSDAYNKTANFENLIKSGMLDQLKTTFQGLGAMSNVDLQTFADAQASLDKPPEVRAEIFRRVEQMIGTKLPVLQQRMQDLSSGQYGRAQPAGAPQPAAPPAVAPASPQAAPGAIPGTSPPPPPGFVVQ